MPSEPLTDEQLWGEPGKSAHDGPGRMSQEEIDDLILEQTLETPIRDTSDKRRETNL